MSNIYCASFVKILNYRILLFIIAYDIMPVGKRKVAVLETQNENPREFDTSLIKKVPQSLIIGLFFCQLFRFTI